MFQPIFTALRLTFISALLGSLAMASSAWAYKVEKICEDVPATSKEPAYKKCKVVKAKEGGSAKGDGKGDGKGDAKGDGKGDGKGASKGDAKADAKK